MNLLERIKLKFWSPIIAEFFVRCRRFRKMITKGRAIKEETKIFIKMTFFLENLLNIYYGKC